MKHPAKVRFIGDSEHYKRTKGEGRVLVIDQSIHFDEDGNTLEEGPIASHVTEESNPQDFVYSFAVGKLYPAYFLEFWQGERTSLHVKNNLGEITDFNHLEDFEVVKDVDDVLNTKEAIVRCITHKFDDKLFDLNCGNEYVAIGVTNKQFSDFDYLVVDESHDCYFYPAAYFEVISDPYGLLDKETGQYVYDWPSLFYDGEEDN